MTAENTPTAQLGDAERLALAYAPQALRSAYHGVLLLDAQLRRIASGNREPALAQLKLAWWRDACGALREGRRHPVLEELGRSWRADTAPLSNLVDAWEEFGVGEAGALAGAEAVAAGRAIALAAVAHEIADGACTAAARRWTLVDLAIQVGDKTERAAMLATAREIKSPPLARSLRPLAMLDGLARRALRRGSETMLGDRLSPFAAVRLGIFGR